MDLRHICRSWEVLCFHGVVICSQLEPYKINTMVTTKGDSRSAFLKSSVGTARRFSSRRTGLGRCAERRCRC